MINPAIARMISPYLDKDEELIAVERLQTRTSVAARALTIGYSNLANQYHLIGLTNSKVYILPLNRITWKPKEDKVFTIEFNEIEIRKDKLFFIPLGKDKPKKYHFMSGIKALTKLDKDEFLYLLEKKLNECE